MEKGQGLQFSDIDKKNLLERYEDFLSSGTKMAKITPILLALIATPGLLAFALVIPNLVKLFEGEKDLRSSRQKNSYRVAFARARKRGFLKIIQKEGSACVALTKKGENTLYRELLNTVRIIPQEKWDQKWRIVIFDFPVKYNFARDLFRQKLKKWNFQQIQKSVFLCPWPCLQELSLLRRALKAEHYVLFLETIFCENEERWRKVFHLKYK